MSTIIRSRHIHGLNSISKRLFSSKASAVNDLHISAFDIYEKSSIDSDVNQIDDKVGGVIRTSPSEVFLKSLPETHFLSGVKLDLSGLTQKQIIKRQIYRLAEIKDYESLISLFLKITDSSLNSRSWKHFITSDELSYYLRSVIDHEINLMSKAAREKLNFETKGKFYSKRNEARRFREGIRKVYSNLLYADSQEYIYDQSKRADLYNSTSLTGYKLSVSDYENLIYLELHNFKLDLASKWFQRFEEDYPNFADIMPHSMWVLKLQTYCGGDPRLWPMKNNYLTTKYYNPRKSKFKKELSFLSVFNEYCKSRNVDKSGLILDDKFKETLIYSIGYSKNLKFLSTYIESTWGIKEDGEVDGRLFTALDGSEYPTIGHLKAIVISYCYNQEFFKAMRYTNLFQKHYPIDLAGVSSKNFWENIFKWCNYSTSFNEERALNAYLKQTSMSKTSSSPKSLIDMQKDADFDYEGFLAYLNKLKSTRSNTFNELWNLFNDTSSIFSDRICKIYLDFLKEEYVEVVDEEKYYGMLKCLLKFYHQYHVSSTSFNKRLIPNPVNDIDLTIRGLYEDALKSLVEVKWKATYMGQCQPLINEWSIDLHMRDSLTLWLRSEVSPKFREMIEKRRENHMIALRTEDSDTFLDLI
ncbi:uncharacterized protein PRCAT00002789001 [Priceomyces carsonii]|uniref:uncharacterized protein n=1 Tax=Priceomyces carsonii TaxID=28549 RepID=UPI002ED8F4D7|nr:unnamed protein product [Priceomyces carsonii]